jgi:hypothetical protein
MTIETEIDALATHIAREATEAEFTDAVKALDVLTKYYATVKKHGTPSSDEDEASFETFTKGLKELENGKAVVRSS